MSEILQSIPILISTLLKDVYMITVTSSTLFVGAFMFWHRSKIYRALGIEDTNLVHLSIRDIWQKGWRAKVDHFQICVWLVLAQGQLHDESEGSPTQPPTIQRERSYF